MYVVILFKRQVFLQVDVQFFLTCRHIRIDFKLGIMNPVTIR